MSGFLLKKGILSLFLVFVLIDGILFAIWTRSRDDSSFRSNQVINAVADGIVNSNARDFTVEIDRIKDLQPVFDEFKEYFQELAEKKGGSLAFDLLKIAPIPSNIDMHLLGHAVGDILYRQNGLNGITDCTNDFRNACSHSIVVGLFFDKGEGALAEIAEACRRAPGGTGAYTMCFHGLGHGILAYTGYDMKKAAMLCEKTGTLQYQLQESSQCVSGTVMEIIGGGFHDKELWAVQRKKYLSKEEPLALCSRDFISNEARPLCFDYLTPYLFEAIGADQGHPSPTDFERAFDLCDKISSMSGSDRVACYGGFGKEFVGLVQQRDIRQQSIENISDESLSKIHSWCSLADAAGIDPCTLHALSSIFWGGENNRDVSIRFCGLAGNVEIKKNCFHNLIGQVSVYVADPVYRLEFCSELPDTYLNICQNQLHVGS